MQSNGTCIPKGIIKRKSRPKNSERILSQDPQPGESQDTIPTEKDDSQLNSEFQQSLGNNIESESEIAEKLKFIADVGLMPSNNNIHQFRTMSSPIKGPPKQLSPSKSISPLKMPSPIKAPTSNGASSFNTQPQQQLQPPSRPNQTIAPPSPATKSAPREPQQSPLFCWELYLKNNPGPVAPKKAFMQSPEPLVNKFCLRMKVEAKDPRAASDWRLASVIDIIGPRLRLRFDGGDAMNDFYELIDSDNIRPVNSKPNEILTPPMAFKGNLSLYPKFVEKELSKDGTLIAPAECFLRSPKRPERNFFEVGMKLEAIDRKHPHLICPATIGESKGVDINVVFDGWRGSFDYKCRYDSRDIFPINWCKENNHYLAPPNSWETLVSERSDAYASRVKSPAPSISSNTSSAASVRTKLKPRGRPLKNSNTKPGPKVKGPRVKGSRSDLFAKPKSKFRSKHIIDESTASEEDEPTFGMEDIIDDADDSLIEEKNKICQRVVPYDEWRGRNAGSSPSKSQTSGVQTSPPVYNESTASDTTEDSQPFNNKKLKTEVPNGGPSSVKNIDNNNHPDSGRSTSENVTKKSRQDWTVRDVIDLIRSDESLAKYSSVFENHEIDGKAFVLLTTDIMVNHMGLKIGPVLKINNLIEQAKRSK